MSTFALTEIHGGSTHDGLTSETAPPEVFLSIAKTVMILVAADGVFSDVEREYYFSMMRGFGVPEPAIELLQAFDPVGKQASEYLKPEYRGMARHFLYDAIKVSRVDGYHEKERAAILATAATLGVDSAVVVAIEGLIEIEDSVRNARLALLRQPAGG